MYTLGNLTLPYPKKLTREFIETSAENLLMEGKTTKRVQNRKERFTLEYMNLTQSEVNSVLTLFAIENSVTFTVNEANLTIGPTEVLVDVVNRNYPPSGTLYRENLSIVLTEVI